jgi:hypothetical protein
MYVLYEPYEEDFVFSFSDDFKSRSAHRKFDWIWSVSKADRKIFPVSKEKVLCLSELINE